MHVRFCLDVLRSNIYQLVQIIFQYGGVLAATLIILRRRRHRRKNAAATLLNKNKRAWIRITNLDRQISGAFVSTFIPAKMSDRREFFR